MNAVEIAALLKQRDELIEMLSKQLTTAISIAVEASQQRDEALEILMRHLSKCGAPACPVGCEVHH